MNLKMKITVSKLLPFEFLCYDRYVVCEYKTINKVEGKT